MILYAQYTKEFGGKNDIKFKINGSTPTSAIISYIEVEKVKDRNINVTRTLTTPVTSAGGGIFIVSFSLLEKTFTLKLNTEPKIMSFSEEFGTGNIPDDGPLIWSGGSGGINLQLPPCDYNKLLLQIFNADGVELEAYETQLGSTTWYIAGSSGMSYTPYNGASYLFTIIQFNPSHLFVKVKGDDWQTLSNSHYKSKFYVRVSNITDNVLSNGIARSFIPPGYGYNAKSRGTYISLP